jgi:hypothetical protein
MRGSSLVAVPRRPADNGLLPTRSGLWSVPDSGRILQRPIPARRRSIVGKAIPVPQTIEQAFSALDKVLTSADRNSFMRKPERKAVIEAHMLVGLYIRNAWFRSTRTALNGYLREKGARSLDDASSLLLTIYWRHLNGLSTDLD